MSNHKGWSECRLSVAALRDAFEVGAARVLTFCVDLIDLMQAWSLVVGSSSQEVRDEEVE